MRMTFALLLLFVTTSTFAVTETETACDQTLTTAAQSLPAEAVRRAVEILSFITRTDGFMKQAMEMCTSRNHLTELACLSHVYTIPPPPTSRLKRSTWRVRDWLKLSQISPELHQRMLDELSRATDTETRLRFVDRLLGNLENYAAQVSRFAETDGNAGLYVKLLDEGAQTQILLGNYGPFRDNSLRLVGPALEGLKDAAVRDLVRMFLGAHLDTVVAAQHEMMALLNTRQSVKDILAKPRPVSEHVRGLIVDLAQNAWTAPVAEVGSIEPTQDLEGIRQFLSHPDRLAHRPEPGLMSPLAIDAEIGEALSLLNTIQIRAKALIGHPPDWAAWSATAPTNAATLASFHARLRAQGQTVRLSLARLGESLDVVDQMATWTLREAEGLESLDLRDTQRPASHRRALESALESLPMLTILAAAARAGIESHLEREQAIAGSLRDLEFLVARRLHSSRAEPTTDDELALALAALAGPKP